MKNSDYLPYFGYNSKIRQILKSGNFSFNRLRPRSYIREPERRSVASPNGPRGSAAKPRTAAHPTKLDSDEFDDEAARYQTGGLIES